MIIIINSAGICFLPERIFMLTNGNVLAGTEGLSVPIFPFIGVKLILGVVSYNGTGTNVVARAVQQTLYLTFMGI